MAFQKITEQTSIYSDLDKKSVAQLLSGINEEDKKVALAVEKIIPQIEALVTKIVERMKRGGRIFYIGAGTSGRLGVLDASEIPPTFGIPSGWVIGLIAGGESALTNAVENAEDDIEKAWEELQALQINNTDTVIGIAASGTTPYVIGGLRNARKNKILTASISCNPDSPVSEEADIPIEVIVGPEFVTGSTRLKSGTAQKLILNMITTGAMVKLGKIYENLMIDVQMSNEKLVSRAIGIVKDVTGCSDEVAKTYLDK